MTILVGDIFIGRNGRKVIVTALTAFGFVHYQHLHGTARFATQREVFGLRFRLDA